MSLRWLAAATLLLLMYAAGCSRADTKPSGGSLQRYQLNGRIVRLADKGQSAVIRHQKIEGWMEAMTMEFPVKDEHEFRRLHPGDQIAATVFVRDMDYWIGEIHHDGRRSE